MEGTAWEGLHPHAFRRLIATELDGQALTAHEIADYLGHEQVSMTQDAYMKRGIVSSPAAEALANMQLEG
ncbi:tyrosine-type recombinase/integrase [Saccharopolyspora pogona]|uniref:tyrosine-type recombinase/integrase n=1 Tax=Saccharopolyspora pogona TaxID=333966 RepID=UPI001CC26084|nr:tyrosine-type recombinase/integrase [Saccharopolyspora pogona]